MIHSFDELADKYNSKIKQGSVYYSDLSHVITMPFKLAIDIASQCNEKIVDRVYNIIHSSPITKQHDNQTDTWVDIESAGNIAAIKAQDLAELLFSELVNKILVIYSSDIDLTFENELLLAILQNLSSELTIKHLSKTPSEQLALLSREQIKKTMPISKKIEFNNGMVCASLDRESADYYLNLNHSFLPLQSYQLPKIYQSDIVNKSTPSHTDLIGYAWFIAFLGASDLAIRILKHAHNHSDEKSATALLLTLQYIRLVNSYFDDVVDQPYNNIEHLDADTKDKLYYAKAYCSVLGNRIEEATDAFSHIDISPNMPLTSLQALYRLNIYALYHHRIKKSDVAFELEHKIETALLKTDNAHTQIRYINSLNLARLYRSVKNIAESKKYYDLAYEAIAGLKSETDYVYANINYASLYESEDSEKALRLWLKAAMHWLGMRHKKALGWRALRALLRRTTSPRENISIPQINGIFADKLISLATKLSLKLETISKPKLAFARLDNLTETPASMQYISSKAGFSYVYAKSVESANETLDDSHQQLSSIVLSLLRHFHCLPSSIKNEGTMLIDTHNHIEMPENLNESLVRCYLLGIKNCIHENETVSIPEMITSKTSVFISPSVDMKETKKATITFKRFKANLELNNSQSKLFALLSDSSTVTLDKVLEECDQISFSDLVKEDVIRLNCAEINLINLCEPTDYVKAV